MRAGGVGDVEIVPINGTLTDHYDPTKKVLALSRDNYYGTSIAALGVAAHEAGHAIQHKVGYAPLNLRMALVPITNFACQLLPIVMLGGFFLFQSVTTLYIGVAIYLILAVFQLVTLPVEFNASARAKESLKKLGIVGYGEEAKCARRRCFDVCCGVRVFARVVALYALAGKQFAVKFRTKLGRCKTRGAYYLRLRANPTTHKKRANHCAAINAHTGGVCRAAYEKPLAASRTQNGKPRAICQHVPPFRSYPAPPRNTRLKRVVVARQLVLLQDFKARLFYPRDF